jgi:hypothetical protein
MGAVRYACENDRCPRRGVTVYVPSGGEATCRECGWFLSAVYDHREGVAGV